MRNAAPAVHACAVHGGGAEAFFAALSERLLRCGDEEGSGITAAELDDAELEELFAVGSRTWSLAFRGREEQRLDAPPHALLGGALDDGFVTHVHEEKGRADAGADGV